MQPELHQVQLECWCLPDLDELHHHFRQAAQKCQLHRRQHSQMMTVLGVQIYPQNYRSSTLIVEMPKELKPCSRLFSTIEPLSQARSVSLH
jgi:hypothetical protein